MCSGAVAIELLCNQGSTVLFSFLEIACSTKEVPSFIGFDTHLKPNISTQLNHYIKFLKCFVLKTLCNTRSVDSFIHFPLYLVWPYDLFWFCTLPTKVCVRVMWQKSLPDLITHIYQTKQNMLIMSKRKSQSCFIWKTKFVLILYFLKSLFFQMTSVVSHTLWYITFN